MSVDKAGANVGTRPTVTVLIPTFNRVEFLDEAITSVLEQDYDALELLVLDDGSTDGTRQLLERYGGTPSDRFRWTWHENMGQARTLNRGFDMAEGELVGYLSSDDVLLPSAISKLAGAVAADPDVVVAYPAWEYMSEDGEKIDNVMPKSFTLLHAVRASDPVIGPGALARRSAVNAVGGWNTGLRYSADFEFWLRIAALGSFTLVPEVLARYRWHETMAGRSSEGFEIASERFAITDDVYSSGVVGEELKSVENEAYRSALLVGAALLGGNAPWERFFLGDRLNRQMFEKRRESQAVDAARLRDRIDELRGELDILTRRIAALGDTLARQDNEVDV